MEARAGGKVRPRSKKIMSDDFGDRMKLFEQAEAGRRLMPLLPVIIRLDGKGFHNWTADLERPYDLKLSDSMVELTERLVDESAAKIGYTQSDEITLVLYSDTFNSQLFFDGKIQKLTSVLASMATGFFNEIVKEKFKEERPLAFFDCRAWNVPTKIEAANAVLWREQDAAKNSISMAARAYFSHAELQGKSGSEMQEMLFSKCNINWNDYPPAFKRGIFISRKKVFRELSTAELMNIPEKFRPKAEEKVERTDIAVLPMPKFAQVINRVEVIFSGEEPLTEGNGK